MSEFISQNRLENVVASESENPNLQSPTPKENQIDLTNPGHVLYIVIMVIIFTSIGGIFLYDIFKDKTDDYFIDLWKSPASRLVTAKILTEHLFSGVGRAHDATEVGNKTVKCEFNVPNGHGLLIVDDDFLKISYQYIKLSVMRNAKAELDGELLNKEFVIVEFYENSGVYNLIGMKKTHGQKDIYLYIIEKSTLQKTLDRKEMGNLIEGYANTLELPESQAQEFDPEKLPKRDV
jgi:hypothetical protein